MAATWWTSAASGITLPGRAVRFRDGALHFAPRLARTIARGDGHHLSVLDGADAYPATHGLDLPQDPGARRMEPDPACVPDPILALDPQQAGIFTIIWGVWRDAEFLAGHVAAR
jgi:putative flavoprotein involved in K+ transport